MKRSEKLEQLETVLSHIAHHERKIGEKMPSYYKVFSNAHKWEIQCEINKKCLAFWKRKFNRILLTLGYKL